MSSRPSSERLSKFAPLFFTVVGLFWGGWIGFAVAVNYATVEIAKYQAQHNGDDGGASEGAFALLVGLPVGAVLGALSGWLLGLVVRHFADKKRPLLNE